MKDWVIADNPVVGSILRKIVSVVVDGGAELHPSLRMMESDGAMWLSCEDHSPAAAQEKDESSLVRMPRELLVPLDGASWEDRTDRLALIKHPAGLSPVQIELLDLHISLYNAAGKLPWFVQYHPGVLLQDNPSVLSAVLRLRPEQEVTWMTQAEVFVKTRLCWIEPDELNLQENENGEESSNGSYGIFPVIDIINNRHDAPRFTWQDNTVSVKMETGRGSPECFAHYGGRRDVLDLALGLGYLDHTTPYAHSAPVQVTVPGFGILAVEGVTAKPMHLLDPPRVKFSDEGLILSHLTCNINNPERLHVVLALALQGALRRSRPPEHPNGDPLAFGMVMNALVKENRTLLAGVELAAAPLTDQWPAADLLIRACRRQAELFERGLPVRSP
jgi:hypothetical protein